MNETMIGGTLAKSSMGSAPAPTDTVLATPGHGSAVIGGDGMLGRAIMAELKRAGASCRSCTAPASPAASGELRRGLQTDCPATVYWSLPERAGIGRHRLQPASLAVHAMASFIDILDACRGVGVARLVNVVPHCAYPGEGEVPLQESALWDGPPDRGLLAYGSAMRTTIALAEAARAEHGLLTLSVIVTGLYGPGDVLDTAEGQVVGAMVRRFDEAARSGDERVRCWGDGTAERELLFVDDAARGIIALSTVPDEEVSAWPEAIVNIGGLHSGAVVVSTTELAEAVAAAVGYSGRIEWDAAAPSGRARVALDDTRLSSLIREQPPRPLEDGLARTVADYRRHVIVAGHPAAAST